jgi:apolipoprotein D and lipocalin family protein
MKILKLVLLGILTSFSAYAAETKEMKTVDRVDLSLYVGRWYEVAAFPQKFQQDCFCTRADYSVRSNGKINVLNACNKGSAEGELSTAKGYAKISDKKTNSKLKVTFFWPFFGDYWIIGLDKDYRYAVVSSPDRDTLWILSRQPILEPQLLEEAKEIAYSQGLDLNRLVYSSNETCLY